MAKLQDNTLEFEAKKTRDGLLKKSQDIVAEFAASIESLRSRIAKLESARTSIAAAPCPREEAIQKLDASLDARAAEQRAYVGDFLRPDRQGSTTDLYPGTPVASMDFLFVACRNQVREFVIKKMDEVYARTPGIAGDERQRRLEEIDRELLDLALAEEGLIRVGERGGMTIVRRPAADPRAVLAADSELPD